MRVWAEGAGLEKQTGPARRPGVGAGGGWKEVRSAARAANKARSGARSPRGDPRPAPLSRRAPGPLFRAGRTAPRAHARAPGPGSSWASQADSPARPEGAKPHAAPKTKRSWLRGDSMLMYPVRKQGGSGACCSHSSTSSPGGAERAPKWTEVGDRLRGDSCLDEKWPRLRRGRRGLLQTAVPHTYFITQSDNASHHLLNYSQINIFKTF